MGGAALALCLSGCGAEGEPLAWGDLWGQEPEMLDARPPQAQAETTRPAWDWLGVTEIGRTDPYPNHTYDWRRDGPQPTFQEKVDRFFNDLMGLDEQGRPKRKFRTLSPVTP